MNTALEFHDSNLAAIERLGTTLTLHLRPAYLHVSPGRPGIDPGTGYTQNINLIFDEATLVGDMPHESDRNIIDGQLSIEDSEIGEELIIPLYVDQPVKLMLQFGSAHLVITAAAVRSVTAGPPKWIEAFNP